jgi:hypothetical protein
MNLDRMLELAGAPALKESVELKKYSGTIGSQTMEVMAKNETDAKSKIVTKLEVPMTKWKDLVVKLVESTVDGISLEAGDSVLVTNQTDASVEGVRVVEEITTADELNEGPANDNLSRSGMPSLPDAKNFGLYVGKRGSGELSLTYKGDRADCLSHWHDDIKKGYKSGDVVFRVVPIDHSEPKTIVEAKRNEWLSGKCVDCGNDLNTPLVTDSSGNEMLQPGYACDICDGVDTWIDGDDYADVESARIHRERESQRLRDTEMEVPTRGEDRPGSGYAARSDDTAMRDGYRYESVEGAVVESESADVAGTVPALDTKAEKKGKKVRVPADVTTAINQRISELKASIAQYNEKGYNDAGAKENAIEALEQIAANLKLEDGLMIANVFYGTLMSPITDLFPPKVVKFLHSK